MNCIMSEEYIMKYFDGNINDIEQAQLKQHIKTCKSCHESFNSMSEIFGLIREEADIEPPVNFEASVMQKLRTFEENRKIRRERILFAIYALVTVALGILTFVFILGERQAILKALSTAGANPGVMRVIYYIVDKFYAAIDLVKGFFVELSMIVSNIYYYLIAAFTLAYIITRPNLFSKRQNRGEEHAENNR
ncbi:MAG: zf-HC2 domain-containing protein [Bacillota bacterium]|nr:zf-HC2 domain-containing protein [Bacillota bacterium]